jgi:hypothetical protein
MVIVCNGMLRSGSTLQFNLVKDYLTRVGADLIVEGWQPSEAINTSIMRQWAREETWHILKTHWVPSEADCEALSDAHVYFLFTIRDLRDSALSRMRVFRTPPDEILRNLSEECTAYSRLNLHAKSVLVRYEDLYAQGAVELGRMLRLLGIPEHSHIVDDVLDDWVPHKVASRLAKQRAWFVAKKSMKALLRSVGVPVPSALRHDSKTLLHGNHLSKGRGHPGAWKRELDSELAGSITREHGAWLVHHGYDNHL